MILLNEQAILTNLTFPIKLHLFESIDSTNQFLNDIPPRLHDDKTIDVCCAEMQTQGRGRFGRHWHSPFGENIYCSSRWYINEDISRLSGLGLIVSMAVIATLNLFHIDEDISIKWPNDLLWQDKKLCGNLIEMRIENKNRIALIIGIGLNVNSLTKNNNELDRPWCSLHEITGNYFDRNQLIVILMTQLKLHLEQFLRQGLAPFMPGWKKLDYLYGKFISVLHVSEKLLGQARGINQQGQLILVDEQNKTRYLSSGETSLHSSPREDVM